MTPFSDTRIFGMPYFPGIARGILRKGLRGAAASNIVLLSLSEIKACTLRPAAFLIVEGTPFSHTMIALLGYGVPVIVISKQQASDLVEGMMLQINGSTGEICRVDDIGDLPVRYTSPLPAGKAVLTADGVAVNLCASVRNVESVQLAVDMGAQAIGLVRTEFLVPADGGMPDADYYQETFHAICGTAAPLAVTFRLLDLAEDKMPAWMPASKHAAGTLGLQGVRLYANDLVRSAVTAQLSAINTLTDTYRVGLLIPYLVRLEELRYWRGWVEAHLSHAIEIGAMAETPASVLDIANWLDEADFIAIGCNDLMQCLFAADRDRPELLNYLDPYAPVLYRLLKDVAQTVSENIGKVQNCGVLSQLPGILPILIGLGYRTFSVDAHNIPYLAQTVTLTTLTDAERMAKEVCAARESREVLEIVGLRTGKASPFLS